MAKDKNKIFWKIVAEDYCTPLIHPAAYMAGITTDKFRKLVGVKSVAPTLFEFKKETPTRHKANLCLVEEDFLRHEKRIISKLEKNAKYFNRLNRRSRQSIKELKSFAFWIFCQDLSKYSNKDLINIYLKLFNLWLEMNIWGHLINLSDFFSHSLSNKIVKFLEKHIKKVNYPRSASDVFVALTTPLRKTPFQNQERSLLEVLDLIQKNKKLEKVFREQPIRKVIKEISKYPEIKRAIREHTKNYDWIQFHYAGPVILDERYFIEILAGQVRQKVNASQELKSIEIKEKELALRQRKIIKDLGLSKKELYWIKVAKTFIFLKALRKDIVFWASRLTDPLVNEIAKRLNLSPLQTRFLDNREIESGLKGKKLNKKEINQRILYSIWFFEKGQIFPFTGDQAKEYKRRIIRKKVKKKIGEFKGEVAYPGKVRGIIKIIACAEDIKKMKKGNILVSPATNPNLLPAMKIASAFITNEGGITCHAAIVARELKKPCIIGTKIATKVLRDGDLAEVDANRGVVKILKNKKRR